MAIEIESLVRENIRRLSPYSSARDEFTGDARVFLDANENSFGSPLDRDWSRYPDPRQIGIKKRVAEMNNVDPGQVFVGNGSDEAIDLLFRVFCRPGIDNIVICPPTYGLYEVAAGVNDAAVRRATLSHDFDLDPSAVLRTIDRNTKLVFLCSPNNPTGNSLSRDSILEVIHSFNGIVVVDEAYIQFSDQRSFTIGFEEHPNLVVLQTFSKAWGLAGLRIGCAFASAAIIDLLNKVKAPYNVSGVAQDLVLNALDNVVRVEESVARIKSERRSLADRLSRFKFVRKVFPSDANFLLVRMAGAIEVFRYLLEHGIIVRNRHSELHCDECLRITVGTPSENDQLVEVLKRYEKGFVYRPRRNFDR